jgi:PAS domain S-box-containing protein
MDRRVHGGIPEFTRRNPDDKSTVVVPAAVSQDPFRLLFEMSGDPMWLFDPARGVFVDCNRAAVELMRARGKDELLPRRPDELSPELQPDGVRSRDRAREITAESSARGRHLFEWWAKRLDGEVFPAEVTVTVVPVEGQLLHLTVVRDISERKRMEAGLRESQELLISIAEKLSEAIYRNSPSGGLTFVNPAYLRMFGYDSIEDLRRCPREQLYQDPMDRARLLELLSQEGGFTNQEVRYRRKDGSSFWGLSSSRAVYAADGLSISYHVGTILDITERKRAEDAIRDLNQTLERRIRERTAELSASEARLRTLVEHAPEAMVVFDAVSGRFEECNQNVVELFGLPRDQLLACTPADVSPPFQPDGRSSVEAAQAWIEATRRGQIPVFDWIHRHVSGRLIPCEIRLVRLPGEENSCRIRGSIIDNTDRRRREVVQRATYEISAAVQATVDLDTLYRRIHQIIQGLMPARNFYIALFEPATGLITFPYHVDEMSPHPEPLDPGTGLTGYVYRTGKPLLVNRRMRKRRVGEGVIFEGVQELPYVESGVPAAIWLGVPLLMHGRTLGVMAVQDYQSDEVYDQEHQQILMFVAEQTALAIDQKRAEQARRESEEKFRALFEASSQGVMLHDEEQFLEVNPAAVKILGFSSAEELVGKHPAESAAPIQPGGERAEVLARKFIADCLAHGSARFDWLCRNNRGRDIPVEVILTRIQWGGRQVIQAVINDITERKRAEAELLRALTRERELSALKSNFVSMISHEFRTPLSIIMSSAEILDSYFDRLDPVERQDQLRSIQKNSRRMARLMEDVLLLGQADAGKLEFKPALLDLRDFLTRLIEEILAATQHRCPIGLRAAGLPPLVQADERLLRHVFVNLLTNAVKYSADESPVDLQVETEGGELVFRVSDRGIGIPPQDLEWLFNSFHRGRNVGQRPGTGLGLVIVKRCVERHGGKVQLHSLEQEGTTVVVSLPLLTTDSVSAPAAPSLVTSTTDST